MCNTSKKTRPYATFLQSHRKSVFGLGSVFRLVNTQSNALATRLPFHSLIHGKELDTISVLGFREHKKLIQSWSRVWSMYLAFQRLWQQLIFLRLYINRVQGLWEVTPDC